MSRPAVAKLLKPEETEKRLAWQQSRTAPRGSRPTYWYGCTSIISSPAHASARAHLGARACVCVWVCLVRTSYIPTRKAEQLPKVMCVLLQVLLCGGMHAWSRPLTRSPGTARFHLYGFTCSHSYKLTPRPGSVVDRDHRYAGPADRTSEHGRGAGVVRSLTIGWVGGLRNRTVAL